MPHCLISAAHKSSGKTTVSVGLCAAFRLRGAAVQPFKKGPDYIDPLWLGAAAGRSCINLDFFTMSQSEIRTKFACSMAGSDIAIIEGNKGLYDGLELDGSNSNAALATLLGSPVILVIDARGMTRGIAPLILGYQEFDKNIEIAGVILNQVGGYRHEGKLRRVIEHYTDVPVVGSVHRSDDLNIVERHLGLIPNNEAQQADEKIRQLGETVARQVDLDRILAIASSGDEVTTEFAAPPNLPSGPLVRIGIPRDRAFGFYYPDDLQALENAGAELVMFDTVRDTSLPRIDALFIGGGFPETAMEELEANGAMRQSIADFIEAGGPTYAECGGLMYLARSLTWRDKACKMVGVVPGDVVMKERPQGRGYVRLRETADHPWPRSVSAPDERFVNAHEFHYSSIGNLEGKGRFAFEVLRGTGIDGVHDGFLYKNLLASYTHMRNAGQNPWAERFVRFIRAAGRSGRRDQEG